MTNIAKMPDRNTTSGHIATEVRALIARRRTSGRQLAMQIGKSQPWMSRRLTGEVPFDVEELTTIAALLDTNPADLFPTTDDGPRHGGNGLALSDAELRVIIALRAANENGPASEETEPSNVPPTGIEPATYGTNISRLDDYRTRRAVVEREASAPVFSLLTGERVS